MIAFEAIPMDSEDIVNQVLAIVRSHVSEIWSPPRVNALAQEHGSQPGFSYEIQCNDGNGEAWDFDVPAQRAKCVRHILEQQPAFRIGSPMCTAFSVLQGPDQSRMSKEKWDAMLEKGIRHMGLLRSFTDCRSTVGGSSSMSIQTIQQIVNARDDEIDGGHQR